MENNDLKIAEWLSVVKQAETDQELKWTLANFAKEIERETKSKIRNALNKLQYEHC